MLGLCMVWLKWRLTTLDVSHQRDILQCVGKRINFVKIGFLFIFIPSSYKHIMIYRILNGHKWKTLHTIRNIKVSFTCCRNNIKPLEKRSTIVVCVCFFMCSMCLKIDFCKMCEVAHWINYPKYWMRLCVFFLFLL